MAEPRTRNKRIQPKGSGLQVLVQRDNSLGRRLVAKFNQDRSDRKEMEQQWLEDDRLYRGINETEIETRIKERGWGSKVNIRITRTKVRTQDAKLRELVFGPGKMNWSLTPTPIPTIASPTGDPRQDAEKAKVAAENMAEAIRDQLTELQYEKPYGKVTHRGHRYGTGVLKGPLNRTITRRVWAPVNGAWALTPVEEIKPYIEHVPHWDIYLDMMARSPEDSDHIFHRRIAYRHDLLRWARMPGMRGDVIRDYVGRAENGDCQLESWEQELSAQGKSGTSNNAPTNRYEPIECWGIAEVDELVEAGVKLSEKERDEKLPLEAAVFLFKDGTIFKADLNPFAKKWRPFTFYFPETDDGQVFGISLPSILRDPARAYNAVVRTAIDNGLGASGPQVMRLKSAFPGAGPVILAPWAVHEVDEMTAGSTVKPIEFITPPNNVGAYLAFAQALKNMLDEVPMSPAYEHGGRSPGAGRTKGGLELMMGAADTMMIDSLAYFDLFHTTVIEKFYEWNMQFNPREDIKGDFSVAITGAQALANKAEKAAALDDFHGTLMHPVLAPFVRHRELIRLRGEAHDLSPDGWLKSKEEMLKELAEMQAQLQGQDQGAPGPAAPGQEALPSGMEAGAPEGAPPLEPESAEPAGSGNETLDSLFEGIGEGGAS